MAALDFPSSPTGGQVFVAPNGVVYIYDSVRTVWQVQPISAGFTGDFSAYGTVLPSGAWATCLFGTVYSGNVGGYFNPATGVFKPPKGRYKLTTWHSGYYSGAVTQVQAKLRKNGVDIPNSQSVSSTAGANYNLTVVSDVIVDANGTDYFDVQYICGPGLTVIVSWFNAVPIAPNVNLLAASGDFFAAQSTSGWPAGSTVILPPVVTGNAGGYYNQTNGRWTPPAGRYCVFASTVTGYTGGANQIFCTLRKNGSTVVQAVQVPGTANWQGDPSCMAVLDMNGTDYCDVTISPNAPGNMNSFVWFGAFPISGVQGPMGPPNPGSLGLYSEQVLTAPATQIIVTTPANARLISLEIDASLTGGTADNIYMHAMAGGSPITVAAYSAQQMLGQTGTPGAQQQLNSSNGWLLGSAIRMTGSMRGSLAPNYDNNNVLFSGTFGSTRPSDRLVYAMEWDLLSSGVRNTVTGFRMYSSSAINFLAGSALRAYVVQ